jgi:excisionase family DNA binding protein
MTEDDVELAKAGMPEPTRAAPVAIRVDAAPAWVTVAQLCGRWQLDRKTVYKFITAGILPAWRVGPHMYRIAVSDVLAFEARNRLLAK